MILLHTRRLPVTFAHLTLFSPSFAAVLKPRQLLNTLDIQYDTPVVYLSDSTYDCDDQTFAVSGEYPPYHISALSFPLAANSDEQTGYDIGTVESVGFGVEEDVRWRPEELFVGWWFVVKVGDSRGNVRYSKEKVTEAGNTQNCSVIRQATSAVSSSIASFSSASPGSLTFFTSSIIVTATTTTTLTSTSTATNVPSLSPEQDSQEQEEKKGWAAYSMAVRGCILFFSIGGFIGLLLLFLFCTARACGKEQEDPEMMQVQELAAADDIIGTYTSYGRVYWSADWLTFDRFDVRIQDDHGTVRFSSSKWLVPGDRNSCYLSDERKAARARNNLDVPLIERPNVEMVPTLPLSPAPAALAARQALISEEVVRAGENPPKYSIEPK
ncbi:hypothetical protein JCM8547_007631 [Rhodosporidiobolus lusitaniae]